MNFRCGAPEVQNIKKVNVQCVQTFWSDYLSLVIFEDFEKQFLNALYVHFFMLWTPGAPHRKLNEKQMRFDSEMTCVDPKIT